MNKALTLASATATFAALLTGIASNASAIAPCGKTVEDKDSSSWPNATASAVNMRTGASTNCTSIAYLMQGQRADYHCFTSDGTTTWTYLRNNATGKLGWVRDDMLPNNGSHVYCGF